MSGGANASPPSLFLSLSLPLSLPATFALSPTPQLTPRPRAANALLARLNTGPALPKSMPALPSLFNLHSGRSSMRPETIIRPQARQTTSPALWSTTTSRDRHDFSGQIWFLSTWSEPENTDGAFGSAVLVHTGLYGDSVSSCIPGRKK